MHRCTRRTEAVCELRLNHRPTVSYQLCTTRPLQRGSLAESRDSLGSSIYLTGRQNRFQPESCSQCRRENKNLNNDIVFCSLQVLLRITPRMSACGKRSSRMPRAAPGPPTNRAPPPTPPAGPGSAPPGPKLEASPFPFAPPAVHFSPVHCSENLPKTSVNLPKTPN